MKRLNNLIEARRIYNEQTFAYASPNIEYINPEYIISMLHVNEHTDSDNQYVIGHYRIEVDFKDERRTYFIKEVDGDKLLGRDA